MAKRLPDPKLYNDFIRDLELADVYLKESRTNFEKRPTGALSYQLQETTKRLASFERGFETGIHYRLTLYENARNDEPQPFGRIEALWMAVYENPVIPTRDVFRLFKELNLPVNLWPYFRTFVHNASAQAGIPYLVLPARKALRPEQEVKRPAAHEGSRNPEEE